MTTEHYEGHLGKGLVYEDTVPLTYVVVEDNQAITHSQAARNLKVLRILWLMQDSGLDVPDEHSALEPTLLRMESKLDLLVELLGQYISEETKLPDAHQIKISSQNLQWTTTETITVGSQLQVSCYLIPLIPLPLVVSGTITDVETTMDGNRPTLSLEELDEPSAELLEKIIFRNHRRVIARKRQHA